MPIFKDIRDLEEYKDREEAERLRPVDYFNVEREISSFPTSPRGVYPRISIPPPAPSERGEVARAPEGGSKPSNLDRRTAAGRANDPSTIFGTNAWMEVGDKLPRRFRSPHIVVPCIARRVRREVMFAKRLAPGGYRTRKRRNPNSDVEC